MTASPPSERSDARANRGRLLAAAHAVFAERGTDAEMKEIAERAGIGVGTIYRNFATKDELMSALAADAMEQIEAHIDGCLDREDALASLMAFVEGMFEMVDRYGHLMELVLHERQEMLDEATKARMMAKNEAILRRCVEAGILRRDIPLAMLATALHGFAHVYRELVEAGEGTREEARRACSELFLRGCSVAGSVSGA